MSARLLLIDDDARLSAMVGDYLRGSGYQVEVAGSLAQGRERLAGEPYDALVLDLMLPDGDGLDLCRELRNNPRTRQLPLLMLTARGEPMDRIVGLELGADDYLPKPFEPRELLARVKALLRRAAPVSAPDEVLRFGRLEIDLGARVARLAGQPCDLTSHQFDLLVVLAQSPGRVLSRDQIMDLLKGHPLEAFDRSIDVHISRIRAVIEDDPKAPRRVLTVRGAGFRFGVRVVTVEPSDYASFGRRDGDPLAGVAFQRHWEEKAFQAGGGGFVAVAQKLGDFVAGRGTSVAGRSSYRPKVLGGSLDGTLPPFVLEALRRSVPKLDKTMRGFGTAEAQFVGIETRTSAPVRIVRDAVTLQSPTHAGLYPCAEGAGYAGGIVSAAIDGLKVAEAIIKAGRPA